MIYPWQQHNWQLINNQIQQGTLAHAILLTGKPGIGLKQFAKALSQTLLCKTKSACGNCKTCKLFLAGNHPDITEIKPEGANDQIKIKSIRELNTKLHESSQQGGYKIIIIHDADNMNIAASNALLKSLEEPGRDTVFLLLTHAKHLLLPTIISRCRQLDFTIQNKAAMQDWLQKNLPHSQVPVDTIFRLSFNSPLFAKHLISNNKLALRNQLVLALSKGFEPIDLSEKLKSISTNEILFWFMTIISDMIKLKIAASNKEFTLNQDLNTELSKLAKRYDKEDLFKLLDKCYLQKSSLNQKVNLNKQLMLEDLLIGF